MIKLCQFIRSQNIFQNQCLAEPSNIMGRPIPNRFYLVPVEDDEDEKADNLRSKTQSL